MEERIIKDINNLLAQLFQKMKEAGYEWDAEKKELKKVEQTPVIEMKTPEESLGIDSDTYNKIVDECVYGEQKSVWSEDDEQMLGKCIDAASGYYSPEDKQSMKDWLRTIKDRVQPRPKQEWSKKDNDMLDKVIHRIEQLDHYWNKPTDEKMIDWLKSLRPQTTWKPSEEQMENLSRAVNGGTYRTSLLMELYQDLKKLREE